MNRIELKVEMIRHNETAKDLARAMGISDQTLLYKTTGKREFSQKEIMFIKQRYNLSPERVNEIFFDISVS